MKEEGDMGEGSRSDSRGRVLFRGRARTGSLIPRPGVRRGLGVILTSISLVVTMFPTAAFGQEDLPPGWGEVAPGDSGGAGGGGLLGGGLGVAPGSEEPAAEPATDVASSSTAAPTVPSSSPTTSGSSPELTAAPTAPALARQMLWFESFAQTAVSAPVARAHTTSASGILGSNYESWEPSVLQWTTGNAAWRHRKMTIIGDPVIRHRETTSPVSRSQRSRNPLEGSAMTR